MRYPHRIVSNTSAGFRRRFFFAWVTSVLALASTDGIGHAANEPLMLGVGETVELEDVGLSLTFVGVTGDSRCPRDVTCVVAGEAVVVLEARLGDDTTELIFRVPPGGGDELELENLVIAVVKLEPEAISTERIDPDDYVATLAVTQAQ